MAYLRLCFILLSILFLSAPTLFGQSTQSTNRESFDDGAMEKARNEYWYNIRTSGEEKDLQKIEKSAYEAMRSMENRAAFKSLANPAWQQIAGSQEAHNSGRVRDIAADPNNPNVVYITTGAGGVWKTPNITATPIQWIDLSNGLPTLNGGAIAIVPPNTLILGTGESDGDGYKFPPGQGLFKSGDGGNNWTQVSSIGAAYNQILVDSLNPQIIYAAFNGTGFAGQESGGILKSTDGGTTWSKLTLSLSGPLSIAYNTHQPLVLVVGGYGSIYRSADAGATWTKSMTGVSTSAARISIANAPTDPNLFYASIGSGNNATLGVWLSTDAGLTWKNKMTYVPPGGTSTDVNPLGSQQEWCNSIIVRPTNAKQIFVAGLDMYMSSDSGKDNWSQISNQAQPLHNFPGAYVHADHHHIAFVGNILYDCGDGGLAKATSPFNTWNTAINQGLSTLLFVGVDADKSFTYVTGGCQDNSTTRASINSSEFLQTNPGDGGRGWVSPNDGHIVYTTYVYATFFQSLDSGKTYNQNSIQASSGLAGDNVPFYPAYDVSRDGTVVAYGGGNHIWTSTSGGTDSFPIKSDKGIGNSMAVHVWQGEDQTSYMWAGSGSNVWRNTDQGATWLSKSVGETVTGITSNPNNRNEIFVVTYNSASTGKHFFKSEDGGATFTSPATNFPAIGCWSVAYNPNDKNLYVGTDKGVVYSYDSGVTWSPLMNGMPLAEVLSLKLKGNGGDTLLAGTYGRGMFWIDVSSLSNGINPTAGSLPLSLDPIIPNPVTSSNATIGFSLKDPGLTTITLHDILGRELRILDKSYYESGKHQISFGKENLSAGSYFVMLTANGKSVSQKIVVE